MGPHDISKKTFERPSSAVIAVEAAIDFSTCTVCTTCPGAAIALSNKANQANLKTKGLLFACVNETETEVAYNGAPRRKPGRLAYSGCVLVLHGVRARLLWRCLCVCADGTA
jgi:hypothetical protein